MTRKQTRWADDTPLPLPLPSPSPSPSPLLAAWVTGPVPGAVCGSHPDCGMKPRPKDGSAGDKGGGCPERALHLPTLAHLDPSSGEKNKPLLEQRPSASLLLRPARCCAGGRHVVGGLRDTQLHLGRRARGSGRRRVIMASVFSSALQGASLVLAKTLNSIVF